MSETPEKVQPETIPNTTETQPKPTEELRFSAQSNTEPFEIAVLALQNLTLFPETVVPLGVGRPRSIAAVESALATQEKLLGCITVRSTNSDEADAAPADLYGGGTVSYTHLTLPTS